MFHLHEVEAADALTSDLRLGAWIDTIEGAWRLGVSHVTFSTTGSTGKPKRCPHSFDDLQTEARHLAGLFSNRRRIVAATPAHHIYGFILTAMLPDALGASVLNASDLSAGRLAAALHDGDLVVTFPEKWAWIERSLQRIPHGVTGVISTAPCPPGLVDALVSKGLGAMTDIYGSSETAGVATRQLPREDYYTLMPHWRFASVDDIALLHGNGSRRGLNDSLEVLEDGRFRVAGRLDGAVQIGGINVWPESVADRMRGIPGVADIAVRMMREDEGGRLKAFVVPLGRLDRDNLLADIETWIETNLPGTPTSHRHHVRSECPDDGDRQNGGLVKCRAFILNEFRRRIARGSWR